MAITSSPGNFDAIVRSGPGSSVFEDGKAAVSQVAACTWNQGDLICLDTTNHYLRPVASTADAASVVGLSDNQVVSGQLASPYQGLTAVNAAQSGPGFVGPKYGVVASMKLKTGDAFVIGGLVYVADTFDCQTVSSVDSLGSGYAVGVFQGPSAVASAAPGQRAQILIMARFPAVAI